MWAGEQWNSQSLYPNPNREQDIRNTNPGVRSTMHHWTQTCHSSSVSHKHLVCTLDSDCTSIDPATKMQCLNGACIKDRGQTGTCYSHRDCLAQVRCPSLE